MIDVGWTAVVPGVHAATSRLNALEDLLELFLATLKVEASDVALVVGRKATQVRVVIGDDEVLFEGDDQDWELGLERLVGRLKREAMLARLRTMMTERGETTPGPWSVFVNRFASDWLVWNARGARKDWDADMEAILRAADVDGTFAIPARRSAGSVGLAGVMRGRRLIAKIDLGDASYDSRHGLLLARAVIPVTAAKSGRTRLDAYFGHPAISGRDYVVVKVSTFETGTSILLQDDWLTLDQAGWKQADLNFNPSAPWEPDERAREQLSFLRRSARCLAKLTL